MSITLLRSLIAVSETGSFANAATRVNVSQAAVGQQMRRLEELFDTTLFDRSGKQPRLTPLGQALVPKARDVVAAYDQLRDDATGQDQHFGEMTLGAVPSTLGRVVPRAIKQLVAAYPGLRIRVVPGLSDTLAEQVERGALDAALLGPFLGRAQMLDWQVLAKEPFVLIASPELENDDARALLTTQPYIRHTRRAAAGRLAEEWLARRRISVQGAMEMETLEAVASMVGHGLGVSVVPDTRLPDAEFANLRRLPLEDAPERELGLLSRADSPKRRLIQRLAEEMSEILAA